MRFGAVSSFSSGSTRRSGVRIDAGSGREEGRDDASRCRGRGVRGGPRSGRRRSGAGTERPAPGLVPAAAYFPSELIDWAELYANPVLELEPVGFGAVAFERRSFERSVASLVLVAAATCGVYVGLRSGLRGEGWARAVAVAAPSGIGVTAGVQGFTRWSQVPAVRRVGW